MSLTRVKNITDTLTVSGATTINNALTVNTDADTSILFKDGGTNAAFLTANTGDELYVGANNEYAFRIKNDGTKDVAFDNGGRVVAPGNPYFRVQLKYIASNGWNGSSQVLNSTTFWNSPTHNHGTCWDSSTGKFTAPVAGRYLFTYDMRYDSFSGSYFYVDMRVNGSLRCRSLKSEHGNYLMANLTHVINMAIGDYMDIGVYSVGDNSVVLNGDSYLSGILVS